MTYFIALIIFLLPSYLIRFSILGVPTTLLEVLIYVAFIITLTQSAKLKTPPTPSRVGAPTESVGENLKLKAKNPFIIPIILFIVSGIISTIIAPDKREALGLFKAYIIDPIIFFWIVVVNFQFLIFPSINSGPLRGNFQSINKLSNFQTNKLKSISKNENYKIENLMEIGNWKLEILLKTLIASGVIVAIHAIWQKITGDTTVDGRILGIFSFDPSASPNYLAFYLAPITVLAISWQCSAVRKKSISLLLYCFITLLLFIAIWFTGSRAAIGAVVVGILSFFITKYWQIIKSKKIFTLLLYYFITLILIIGWQNTKPDWNATPNDGRISSSNNIRWEIWQTTTKDMIPHNLVWLKGVGLGNYQSYFSNLTKSRVNYPEWISPWAHTPHNIFLNIWVNLGLLGLISFVWILVNYVKFTIYNLQFSNKNNFVTLSLVTVMITILVQGLVDSPVWKNDLWVMFWLIIGLSCLNSHSSITDKN